jgi:hypothetical protein
MFWYFSSIIFLSTTVPLFRLISYRSYHFSLVHSYTRKRRWVLLRDDGKL